jgi:phenylpyruvate tautomerase PptA (4-oxalocrotonate tautomerase family)
MPVYTCTTTAGTLTADVKSALAQEISRLHAEINHVPSTYVNVVFHELPAGGIYTDGVPANPVLVNGWVRSGHSEDKTTRLATEIAAAVSRIASIDADRVLMVIQNSPAHFAIEGGRILPEPGHEQAWLAGE